MPKSKEKEYSSLLKQMSICQKCHLFKTRQNVVPGEGDVNSKVLFIGEGPGQKEDELGRPFVGTAGKLLTQLIEGIDMTREKVYIANVVKCRPPGNRDPLPDEVKNCWEWLKKQVELIDPLLIVLLGRHALDRFLPGMKISEVRGKVLRRKTADFGTRVFMPTYHPAAALYHRKWLVPLKEDFSKIPKLIDHIEKNQEEDETWDSMEIQPSKKPKQGNLL